MKKEVKVVCKHAPGFNGRTREKIIIDGYDFANALLNSSINFF